tara:strand:+ start:1571 stop:2692 length:1122 start_codon:yes stop_codon:yes gene_type:complete
MPWVQLLKENGYKVYAVVASGSWNDQIEAGGAKFIEWKLSRSGRNPITEFRSILGLRSILSRIRPDIVQNFHTKPNIYAPIAARLAGVPVTVSTVTGLGYTFVDRKGLGSRLGRRFNLSMYSLANRLASAVTFQNPEDMEMLLQRSGLNPSKSRFIPGGSGVDISEYDFGAKKAEISTQIRRSLNIPDQAFVAMFVGRLQMDKGLAEFVDAARHLKKKRSDVVFVMVGAPDPGNIRSVPESNLSQWQSEGDVIFTGRREDVHHLMAAANTVVTPTYYREGLPRTLLEAAASGLPLIGTDMPGVREAISDDYNGILIPTRNSNAISNAVERLADNPDLARKYGEASLDRARSEFDHRRVVGAYLKLYDELRIGR